MHDPQRLLLSVPLLDLFILLNHLIMLLIRVVDSINLIHIVHSPHGFDVLGEVVVL